GSEIISPAEDEGVHDRRCVCQGEIQPEGYPGVPMDREGEGLFLSRNRYLGEADRSLEVRRRFGQEDEAGRCGRADSQERGQALFDTELFLVSGRGEGVV